MCSIDRQSAHHRTLKEHKTQLRFLAGGHHDTPYAYVLHRFHTVYGKSRQNMGQPARERDAKGTARTNIV